MKILAIESSAGPASAAVIENGKIIASAYSNVKLTHSQTIMPMVKSILSASLTDISDINAVAVSAGPGSFTGIRIGISAAKGIATPNKLPCIPVSTLLSMAYNFLGHNAVVCAVMDARCNQVYNALFKIEGNKVLRLCDDRALLCDELANKLKAANYEHIILCGDGADIFYPFVMDIDGINLAPANLKYQNATSVAMVADSTFSDEICVSAQKLLPIYLRLPQAERELKAKLKINK